MKHVSAGATTAFVLFVVAMLAAGWIIVESLSPTVDGRQHTYSAQFTDASGLVVGNDVRELGVRVGRVESITLRGSVAEVGFSVLDSTPVYGNTQVAIRYLNLVGQRYLDLSVPDGGRGEGITAPSTTIPTARTIASFDVTSLFNGLRPLFKTLDPGELNELMENILAVVEGRGPDLGSMLGQLREVAEFASDRSQLIGVLIGQLGNVAEQMQYKSPKLNDLISRMGDAFGVLASGVEDTKRSLRLAAASLGPVRLLLAELESAYYGNYGEVDRLVRKWIPGVNGATSILARLPGLIDGLDSSVRASRTQSFTCSSGVAQPTPTVRVLLAGVPVVMCR